MAGMFMRAVLTRITSLSSSSFRSLELFDEDCFCARFSFRICAPPVFVGFFFCAWNGCGKSIKVQQEVRAARIKVLFFMRFTFLRDGEKILPRKQPIVYHVRRHRPVGIAISVNLSASQ